MGSDNHSCQRQLIIFIFQSTLPHGERPPTIPLNRRDDAISIHAPAWGATDQEFPKRTGHDISIHAPAWGATYRERRGIDYDLYFNPRSRMESDSTSRARPSWKSNFNPRSRMGSDEESESVESEEEVFQSTPPAWGATGALHQRRAERAISIHAPRMGSDLLAFIPLVMLLLISIHAPRMGSDKPEIIFKRTNLNFNPRSPHGERQAEEDHQEHQSLHFNPRPPAWGATSAASRTVSAQDYFNPRSRMGSDVNIQAMVVELSISIHAPAWGATRKPGIAHDWITFQSTLPAWGATAQ